MGHGSSRESIHEIAAAWHERLHCDDVSEETRHEFARWRAESVEHQAAYEAIDRTSSILQHAAREPQILALRHETALRLTRRTSRSIIPRRWMAAAALLMVLGAAAAIFAAHSYEDGSLRAWLFNPLHTRGDGSYATATGERLTISLIDGSQVTLDTQTALKVTFTKARRAVQLIRGQALFEVAKDKARPFVVDVRNRRFIAVGTAFDIRVEGEQIKATMVEGTVRVERVISPAPVVATATSTVTASAASNRRAKITHPERDASALDVVTTITAGEQLVVDAEAQDHVRAADPGRITSWSRGQVIFDNTRLEDAIAELNRYSEIPIELADPALADLRLSGAFATSQTTAFVEAITRYFPVRVVGADERAIVLGLRK